MPYDRYLFRLASGGSLTVPQETFVETYILFGGGMALGLAIAIWGIWNLK